LKSRNFLSSPILLFTSIAQNNSEHIGLDCPARAGSRRRKSRDLHFPPTQFQQTKPACLARALPTLSPRRKNRTDSASQVASNPLAASRCYSAIHHISSRPAAAQGRLPIMVSRHCRCTDCIVFRVGEHYRQLQPLPAFGFIALFSSVAFGR
jgi:hypothetical protein